MKKHSTPEAIALTTELLKAACEYHQAGWTIIPVIDKKAAVEWKDHQARQPDLDTTFAWIKRGGVNGIAVVHNQGLCCRDFDTEASFAAWKQAHPDLAATLPIVKTHRGAHVYFTCLAARYLDLGDGELIAGGGHYSVLPPSRHPSGTPYRWLNALGLLMPPTITDLAAAGFLARPPELVTHPSHPTHPTHPPHPTQSNSVHPVRGSRAAHTTLGEDLQATIESVIGATLPQGPGERNDRIFDLMCGLRGIGLNDLNQCKPLARRWYELALPCITTKDWLTTWEDFLHAWGNFNPAKAGLAFALAEAKRLGLPTGLEEYENPMLIELAGICRERQRAVGDNPFFLSTHVAAEVLSGIEPLKPMQVWRALGVLCADGFIKLVSKGSHKERRSGEYRWVRHALDAKAA